MGKRLLTALWPYEISALHFVTLRIALGDKPFRLGKWVPPFLFMPGATIAIKYVITHCSSFAVSDPASRALAPVEKIPRPGVGR